MGGDDAEGWKQLDEAIKLDEFQGRTTKAYFFARAKKNDEAENEYKMLMKSYSGELACLEKLRILLLEHRTLR